MKKGYWTGKKMSEEHRKKLSLSRMGKKHSEEWKRHQSEALKGKSNNREGTHHSEETKAKMRQSALGKKKSPEHIEKMRLNQLGKKASMETRKKMSEKRKGKNSHMWKGGVTAEHKIIRHSLEYQLWREAVFKRDNYICRFCGKRGDGTLHADHIKPFAYYPELRFSIDNGRTLCKPCHQTTETYGARIRFSKPSTNQ